MSKSKRRKVKRIQKRRSSKKHTRKSVNKKYLWLFLPFVVIGYVIYISVLITGVEKNDPLEANGSSSYLLSGASLGDLDKTLWVFEEGEGEDSSIKDAFLVASNKEKDFLLNIYIPGWIYFSFAEEKFGNALTVSNFRYAGEFLEDGRGVEYGVWQFEQMLGTKINNYVWIGDKEQSLYSDIFGNYKEIRGNFNYNVDDGDFTNDALLLDSFLNVFSVLDIPLHPGKVSEMGEGIISNRRYVDILSKISFTKHELRGSEKHLIDLGNSEYLEEELSNMGGLAYHFNSSKYDGVFRGYLLDILDRELEKEQVRVEVYNGSGISGAAGQMARKIENSGCDVVRYENAPNMLDNTVLYIPDEDRFKNSIDVVKEVVDGNVEIINDRPTFMTTGDIVVVLGKDIERIYSF
jgi:hypothetical protein